MGEKPQSVRSIGYIRVDSSDAQNESVHQRQQWAITRFAERNGYEHLSEITDVGWHKNPEECPGLGRVLQLAREKAFSKLLIWKLSCLPGSVPAVLQLLTSLFDDFGVSVRAVTEPIDTSSLATRSMTLALAGICERERREAIDLRLKSKQRKASQGAFASGAVPLGYRLGTGGDLEIDAEAAGVIRRIYEMRAAGQSLRAIADTLNGESIPTRRNGRWHPGTVRYILENPKYKGFVSYHFNDEQFFVLKKGAHAPIII